MARHEVIDTRLTLVIPKKDKDPIQEAKREKWARGIGLFFLYLFLSAAALLVIFPFYYMILASFMAEQDVIAGSFWPKTGSFLENVSYNYSQTVTRLHYWSHLGNTLAVAVTVTVFQLLTTILAAFAFARLQFTGKSILFLLFLSTMMIPGEMLAITNYTTMVNLGIASLNQTRWQAYLALVLPVISSVFYIYLLRQNFMQIPNELYLAAKVDGKSDWGFLWKVMVPLSSPTLITIGILSLIDNWNSYVWPSLVVQNDSYNVISVIIRGEYLQTVGPDGNLVTMYSWQMTASVLVVVPLLILFIIFRKYIMSGTGRAGIKG